MSETILIVDDDRSVTASLALLLKHAGYRSRAAASPAEALAEIEAGGVDLVIQDMNFSRRTTGEEGLALLREIRAVAPETPVVLITAWGSIKLAVEGVRAGAADFVTKPWTNPELLQTVRTALDLAGSARAAEAGGAPTRASIEARGDFEEVVGEAPVFLRVLEVVARVAPTDAAVLITGESGTGKEVVASAIHRNSRRREGPFVKVNLGGISPALFESEMFGHVKGAFTDAYQSRKGRFELADGGTIFLDEIGDLDPSAQVKLLRILQDRTYEVLGSSETRTVDVRVVSATNRDLPALVASGEFREDLLYRLNLIALRMPPLRERAGDAALLGSDLIVHLARVYRRPGLSLEPAALAWLGRQSWPGNVRQLRQVIERAVLVADGDTLTRDDLARALDAGSDDRAPLAGEMTLDEMERRMIVTSLERHGGNVTRVAEALGLSRAALYRRFEKYGISP